MILNIKKRILVKKKDLEINLGVIVSILGKEGYRIRDKRMWRIDGKNRVFYK